MGVIREPGSLLCRMLYTANGTWYSADVPSDTQVEIGARVRVCPDLLTLAHPKDVKRVTEKPLISTENTPVLYKGIVRRGRKTHTVLVAFADRAFTVRLPMTNTAPALGEVLRVDRRFLKPASPCDVHRANRGLAGSG